MIKLGCQQERPAWLPPLLIILPIFFLNLLQAYYTDFNIFYPHEAYYWVWSKHLSWGYFDHPPIVALLIKIGYALIPNQLGIRLPFVVLYCWSLYLTTRLVPVRDYKTFACIIYSFSAVNLLGVFAVPDVPLIFSTAVFLLAYQRYRASHTFTNTAYLGFSMALLVYSKYNGLLIILFIVLLDFKTVLKDLKFYMAAGIALLLYLPHLYWQYENGFPTIMFHLIQRYKYYAVPGYHFRDTLAFIVTQLLLYGPVSSLLLFYYFFKAPANCPFLRRLKGIAYLTFAFFLVMTIRGNVLPQWTIGAFIPLLILVYSSCAHRGGTNKTLLVLTILSLFIATFLRLLLILASFANYETKWYLRPFRNFVDYSSVSQISNGRPVVFINDWKGPAIYEFKEQRPSYSLNTLDDRPNQYSYEPIEEYFWGKNVMVFEKIGSPYPRSKPLGKITKGKILYEYYPLDGYYSFSLIRILSTDQIKPIRSPGGSKILHQIHVLNPYKLPIPDDVAKNTKLYYQFLGSPLCATPHTLYDLLVNKSISIILDVPPEQQSDRFCYVLQAPKLPPTRNSTYFKLLVK